MKKYELLTGDVIELDKIKLCRIRALRDFGNVRKGDCGGYIEKEDNLSHDDNCWIYDNARVYGKARVYDNAKVYGRAIVYDNAEVYGDAMVYNEAKVYQHSRIYGYASVSDHAESFGEARVYGDATVYGQARILHFAKIYGDAHVFGNSIIFDSAKVYGDAHISGNVCICKDAEIADTKMHMSIGPIGLMEGYITFFRSSDNSIYVNTIRIDFESFNDTIDKFEEYVINGGYNNISTKDYLLAIELAKSAIKKIKKNKGEKNGKTN